MHDYEVEKAATEKIFRNPKFDATKRASPFRTTIDPVCIVENITGLAIYYCRKWGIPRELHQDMIQEAWVAALENGREIKAIRRAMDNFAYQNFVAPMSESCLGSDLFGSEIRMSNLPESTHKERLRWRR